MDIQSAASQLLGALGNNPNMLSQFAAHPYSTTASVTGTDETISQNDMSRIIAQLAAQASGQNLSTSDNNALASALLSQSGGSVHNLAGMLFGGGAQAAAKPTASSSSSAKPSTGKKKKRTTDAASSTTAAAAATTTSAGSAANAGGFDLSNLLGALGGSGSGSSGTPSMAEIAARSILGGIAARGMAGLITHAMGTNKKN